MKKISIIAACAILATGAMAQSSPHGKNLIGKQPVSKKEQSRQFTLQLMNKANMANKSTASYERMKAMSEYGQQTQNGPVVFFDSLAFNYSGMRGSQFDFNAMSVGYYNPITGAMIPGNQLNYLVDNFQVYVPNLVGNYTVTYDADDNITEVFLINNGNPDERFLYTYDNGLLLRVDDVMANGSNWDTLYRRYFAYDVNDVLIEDSVMEYQNNMWSIYQKIEYTYDVNGNITNLKTSDIDNMSSVFLPYEEIEYTYNNNNQMETAVYSYYNELTTNMDLEYKDSFEFTSGFDFFTKDNYYIWDEPNTEWLTDGYMERTLNTQMLPEMAAGYEWDGTNFTQAYEERYTYNANGNPTHDSVYLFTGTVIDEDPVYVINYYYEEYWDLGVDRTAAKAQVSVYPNPASDVLTISNSNNEMMNLQIVNALGQSVKKARTSGQGKLTVSDLAPGTYWLIATDAKGNKLHQQAIVKQ